MIPRINLGFPHRPLPPDPFSFSMPPVQLECSLIEPANEEMGIYEEFINAAPTREESDRRFTLFAECKHASCPWVSTARVVRSLIDPGIPCTNAFCKLYELCHDTELRSVLDEHGKAMKPLKVTCLAEAPGTFPIAIAYYLGMRYPVMLERKMYSYRCTTLYLDAKEQAAFQDSYSLIGRNMDRWFFMNHIFVEDTLRMVKEFGEGAWDIVTGDIGKPIETAGMTDRELFLEQYGQFLSALLLLREGGCICLKMFGGRDPPQVSMLRFAIGTFNMSRVFKPHTSRTSNHEAYWVCSGFKRSVCEPFFPSLLNVLRRGKEIKDLHYELAPPDALGVKEAPVYPPFIRTVGTAEEDELISQLTQMRLQGRAQRTALLLRSFDCVNRYRAQIPQKGKAYIDQIRKLAPLGAFYVEAWIARYPIHPVGGPMYDMLRMAPASTAPSGAKQRQRSDIIREALSADYKAAEIAEEMDWS